MAATATAASIGTAVGVSAAQGAANKGGQHAVDHAHEKGAKHGLGGKMEKGLGTVVCSGKLKEKGRAKEMEGREERQEGDAEGRKG